MKKTKLFCSILICSVFCLVACDPNDPENSKEETSKIEELTDAGNNYFVSESGVYYRSTSSSTAKVVHDITCEEEFHGWGGCSDGYENIWSDIVIPTEVKMNGKTYRVTSIDGEAFCGCGHLQSVTIEDGVTEIGENAFSHCYGLKSITIGANVTQIGDMAFCKALTYVGTDSLRSFTSYIQDPTIVDAKWAFTNCTTTTVIQKLYVPQGTKELYANTAPWDETAEEIIEMSK